MSHNNYQSQAQAPSEQTLPSSAQSSALREENTGDKMKKSEDEKMPADVLMKDMIDSQKHQLCELMPQIKRSEEMSDIADPEFCKAGPQGCLQLRGEAGSDQAAVLLQQSGPGLQITDEDS